MALPVRPPTLFAALVAALPTLLAAALAEEVTRVRPSDALDENSDALDDACDIASDALDDAFEDASDAFEDASDAFDDALVDASAAFSFTAPVASEVVDALRRPARRTAKVECRSTWRDAARDIVTGSGGELAMGWMRVGVLGLEVGSFGC